MAEITQMYFMARTWVLSLLLNFHDTVPHLVSHTLSLSHFHFYPTLIQFRLVLFRS